MTTPFRVYLALPDVSAARWGGGTNRMLEVLNVRIDRALAKIPTTEVRCFEYGNEKGDYVEISRGINDLVVLEMRKHGKTYPEEALRFVTELLRVAPGEHALLCMLHSSRTQETIEFMEAIANSPSEFLAGLRLQMPFAVAAWLATRVQEDARFLGLAHAVVRIHALTDMAVPAALALPIGPVGRTLKFWPGASFTKEQAAAFGRLLLHNPLVVVENFGNRYVNEVLEIVQAVKDVERLLVFVGAGCSGQKTIAANFVRADGDFAVAHNIREFLVWETDLRMAREWKLV